ncbi:DUF2934 domain-containing protein [Acidihalobacter prosperus]|uniref:DUF2934 domain-containing protein n=1 Tax=Acidihalobacter prosperus TaxID=160660 RepID=A0A1A6C7K8_9GAMM|nr:DUF2934 domain-containing protein [Acidihalobacter prosperus]OBS10535.1 hypothetical protein Thpro_020251 [Acidihalobacter prosperus]
MSEAPETPKKRTRSAKTATPKTPAKTAAAGKTTAKRTATAKPAASRSRKSKTSGTTQVTPEQRYRMIAEAAFYIAESHGFDPARSLNDWLEAEGAIDARLGGHLTH